MGYIGYSRSERSEEAIENFEVPLSMISKSLVEDFLSEYEEDIKDNFKEEFYNYLESLSISKWKYLVKLPGYSSWHHTGDRYRETFHYSMWDGVYKLYCAGEDRIKIFEDKYKKMLEDTKKEKAEKEKNENEFKYGYVGVTTFERKRGKWVPTNRINTFCGVVKGDWLYSIKDNSDFKEPLIKNIDKKDLKKTNIQGSAVCTIDINPTYKELVKQRSSFKNTKKYFNAIEKILKSK